jgi:hypothetical protein
MQCERCGAPARLDRAAEVLLQANGANVVRSAEPLLKSAETRAEKVGPGGRAADVAPKLRLVDGDAQFPCHGALGARLGQGCLEMGFGLSRFFRISYARSNDVLEDYLG